jgi:hypothetical protein
MFGHEWYYESLRRYVIVFGTMFNNIVVSRRDGSGTVQKRIKVPISYSPKDKLLARVETDPGLNNPVAITLPRMGFEMAGMTYSPERKLNTIQKFTAPDPDNVNRKMSTFSPVPYDINFQLNILVKSAEDGTQILEQILPFFTPEWTNSVRLVDEMDIYMDIPLVLTGVTTEDAYDGDFESRRALIWTLDFMMKGYLFGPIKKKNIIKFTESNFTIEGFDEPITTIEVYPGLTANGEPTTNPDDAVDPKTIEITDNWDVVVDIK